MYSEEYRALPELIRNVQQDKPNAYKPFAELIDAKLNEYIHKHISRVVELRAVRDEDERDIKQEVHIKLTLLFRGTGYEERGAFFTMLYTIAERCVIDFYKHHHGLVYSAELVELASETMADEAKEENETDVQEKQHRMMMHAVNGLPPQQKVVFLLRILNEMEYNEIGKYLEISASTARSVFCKAKKTVMEKIHRMEDEEKRKAERKVAGQVREMEVRIVKTGMGEMQNAKSKM
jgi:RNA polymerase sigma-70 factor, ECF subfamily